MSNNQWNSGQGSNEWAPQQGAANEWGQPQPQTSAQDWGQPQPQQPQQDWTQQPQQSAQEWGQQQPQQPQQDWTQQPQQSAQEWGQQQPQQPQQDWGQQQPQQSAQEWGQQQPQQEWGQQQPQQNWPAQPYPPQQYQGQRAAAKPSPFDFSFKQLSLPGSAGVIFLIGVIAIGVEWLLQFITVLTSGGEFYTPGAMSIVNTLVGGLAGALFKVLVLRVLIEIGVAGAKLLKKAEEPKESKDADEA